jgi:hypothetical protein
VKRILNDLFACLIETSRKTTKEARIKFKAFGTLYLFKNRELAFNQIDEVIDLASIAGSRASNDLFAARQREREEMSFIDSASAVLSRGGGGNFSVKSSVFKSLSNVSQAPSNAAPSFSRYSTSSCTAISRASQNSRSLNPIRKDQGWNKYLRKNND